MMLSKRNEADCLAVVMSMFWRLAETRKSYISLDRDMTQEKVQINCLVYEIFVERK